MGGVSSESQPDDLTNMKNLTLAVALAASIPWAFAADSPPVRVVKNIEYLGAERKEKLDLYLPGESGQRPRPAVLIVHGGGWHGGSKSAGRERNIGVHLAEAGFVCASVDYVLAVRKERFTDNLRQVWPRNLQDCMNGVRFLRANAKKYNIDGQNIGAIGGSAGGHLVAMLAVVDEKDGLDLAGGPYADVSCRIQAAVPMYGVHDLIVHARDRGMALGDVERVLCRVGSPVTYIDAADPPTLILHGTRDHLVPMKQSELLHTALQEAGVSSELAVIADAPHSFHLQPKQRDLRQLVIGFFRQHLNAE